MKKVLICLFLTLALAACGGGGSSSGNSGGNNGSGNECTEPNGCQEENGGDEENQKPSLTVTKTAAEGIWYISYDAFVIGKDSGSEGQVIPGSKNAEVFVTPEGWIFLQDKENKIYAQGKLKLDSSIHLTTDFKGSITFDGHWGIPIEVIGTVTEGTQLTMTFNSPEEELAKISGQYEDSLYAQIPHINKLKGSYVFENVIDHYTDSSFSNVIIDGNSQLAGYTDGGRYTLRKGTITVVDPRKNLYRYTGVYYPKSSSTWNPIAETGYFYLSEDGPVFLSATSKQNAYEKGLFSALAQRIPTRVQSDQTIYEGVWDLEYESEYGGGILKGKANLLVLPTGLAMLAMDNCGPHMGIIRHAMTDPKNSYFTKNIFESFHIWELPERVGSTASEKSWCYRDFEVEVAQEKITLVYTRENGTKGSLTGTLNHKAADLGALAGGYARMPFRDPTYYWVILPPHVLTLTGAGEFNMWDFQEDIFLEDPDYSGEPMMTGKLIPDSSQNFYTLTAQGNRIHWWDFSDGDAFKNAAGYALETENGLSMVIMRDNLPAEHFKRFYFEKDF